MAISHRSGVVLEVDGDDPVSLERDLDAAVQIARETAGCYGHDGILVTRHDYWSFSVTTSPDVPFGEIRHNSQWRDLDTAHQHTDPWEAFQW